MSFKMVLCQVLCLVITLVLHSTTAELDALSIEALVDSKVNMIVEKITQTYEAENNNVILKLNDIHTVVRGTYAQNKEVVAKVASHATDAQQMAATVKRLENATDNLSAGHLEIRKQLTNVTSDLQHLKSHVEQEKSSDDELHKLQNSTIAQQTELVESIKNLRNITDYLLAGQLQIQNQQDSVEKKLNHVINDLIPSCSAINFNETGSYLIHPFGTVEPFLARCDFEKNGHLGGGWTVFQHRFEGSVNFNRSWTMYRDGFGDVNAEHWLGLEKLHVMTKSGKHELLIIMEDFYGNTAYAHYTDFKISSEDEKYELTIGTYSGTAGNSLQEHDGMKFSTFDQENDRHLGNHCAEQHGGGWWYNACYHSNLNGRYFSKGDVFQKGLIWGHWKGWKHSLKSSKMMLRRCLG